MTMQLLIGGIVGFAIGYACARKQFAEWYESHATAMLGQSADQEVVHTIPVPLGWSVELAWEAISRGDELPEGGSNWAVIGTRLDKLVTVYEIFEEEEEEAYGG